jgi:predicted component of type VI protein secretion system
VQTIAIRLVSLAGEAPVAKLEAVFGEEGGDIGRSADCTLVLPDPERRISRKHLQVACRDGRTWLRLISTNLVVELNGVPLMPGAESLLEPGAHIRVGPFGLAVEAVGEPASAADDSMSLLRAPASGPSVFRDLLQGAAQAPRVQEVDLLVGDPTGAGARPPAASLAVGAASADELIAAMQAGLGFTAATGRPTAAQAELVGALLRACVTGALGLLSARAIAKRELGASATQIQLRENNPLKFAPDADAALVMLLAPPRRGFVPPLAAVRDAFDDLRAHEVAVLAGMRAALSAVLDRFDPAALEARLEDQGLWDSLLPVNRRARLWERYSEQHAAIAREIEEHFDVIFADAFAAAYDAQRAHLAQRS